MENMDKGLTVPKWVLIHILTENTLNGPPYGATEKVGEFYIENQVKPKKNKTREKIKI